MKTFGEFFESATAEKAARLGLNYIGFGRYTDSNGKMFLVKNNQLIPFTAHFAPKYVEDQEAKVELAKLKDTMKSPALYKNLRRIVGQQTRRTASNMVTWRDYQYLMQTTKPEDMERLMKVDWRQIRGWFEGWYMGKHTPELIDDFRAIQKVFPSGDTKAYRLISPRKGDESGATGKTAMQSWTDSLFVARKFYATQYGDGDTMVVDDEGRMSFADKRKTHKFSIVKSVIPGEKVLMSPKTYRRLTDFFGWYKSETKNYQAGPSFDDTEKMDAYYRDQYEVVVDASEPVKIQHQFKPKTPRKISFKAFSGK